MGDSGGGVSGFCGVSKKTLGVLGVLEVSGGPGIVSRGPWEPLKVKWKRGNGPLNVDNLKTPTRVNPLGDLELH